MKSGTATVASYIDISAFTAFILRLCGQCPHKPGHLLPADSKAAEKVGTASPQLRISPDKIIHRLSYSHLESIVDLDDDLKRAFYEIECIRGNWSVWELKRQIASLYYERSGLSKDKKKLAALAQKGAEAADPKLAIRDPYVFEFLGLKPKEVMSESHLRGVVVGSRSQVQNSAFSVTSGEQKR